MKNKRCIIKVITLLFSILYLYSCRSIDTENTLTGSGRSAVKFNVLGAEFSNVNAKIIRSSSISIPITGSQVYGKLIDPSTFMKVTLTSDLDEVRPQKDASSNKVTSSAISGDLLGVGVKFRVIAYRDNGDYHTHEDYTVGQASPPMMLDNEKRYDIVVYSFGIPSLPAISPGEQDNINSATVNYDNNNRDFMYQKLDFTPQNYSNNTLNVTLAHKVAQTTITIKSVGLGNIIGVDNGFLNPHYNDGVIKLASGAVTDRTTLSSGIPLNFSGINTTTLTASPVFINADSGSNTTGEFFADVTIGDRTRAIDLPNSFRITPGNKSNFVINLRKCGAYLGPGNTQWKDFMCHNLGANMRVDPFTPAAAIHGAKYQWGAYTGESGRYISQADDQRNNGRIAGWNTAGKPITSWSDNFKTSNDPCPEGYRVPTERQWISVLNSNPNVERVGSWFTSGNYTSALYFRDASGARTLMLPLAGGRDNVDGRLLSRGIIARYWSSTIANENNISTGRFLYYYTSEQTTYGQALSFAVSIRCISE